MKHLYNELETKGTSVFVDSAGNPVVLKDFGESMGVGYHAWDLDTLMIMTPEAIAKALAWLTLQGIKP